MFLYMFHCVVSFNEISFVSLNFEIRRIREGMTLKLSSEATF